MVKHKDTEIVEKDFERLSKELESGGHVEDWEVVQESKSLKVYKKPDDIFTFKAYMTFENVSPELIYLLSCDLNVRKKWDTVYKKVKEIETLSKVKSDHGSLEVSDIVYTCLNTPRGVANRDSCLLRVRREDYKERKFVVFMKTTEHEQCPQRPHLVRAHTTFHGYVIQQDGSNSQNSSLFVMSRHDFGGSIPKFVVNMMASKSPVQWYTELSRIAKVASKIVGNNDKIEKAEELEEMKKSLQQGLLTSKL